MGVSKYDKLTLEDTTHTIADWARYANLPVRALMARIKDGWTVERALGTPVQRQPWHNNPAWRDPKAVYERQRAKRLRSPPRCPHCGLPMNRKGADADVDAPAVALELDHGRGDTVACGSGETGPPFGW